MARMLSWWDQEPQKYERDLMAGALLLHHAAHGFEDVNSPTVKRVAQILETRLGSWVASSSGCSEFDGAVKKVLEASLREYRSAAGQSQHPLSMSLSAAHIA